MDKFSTSVSSSVPSAVTTEKLYWCSKCHKLAQAAKGKCVACNEGVTNVQDRTFQPSVFSNFSTENMEIIDTDYELILIVPGKGKSLQFHFSLRRHYYPYLEAEGTQGKNSVITSAVSLEELRADMHHLGKCLPDLDWDTPTAKGASFLMKVRSGRVYKFNSLQNSAKHCFVVAGPGVLTELTGKPFSLLGIVRVYLDHPTKGGRKDVIDNYRACRNDMSHESILALVKAASGDEPAALKLIGDIGKELGYGKKQQSQKDVFKKMLPGQFAFDDSDEDTSANNAHGSDHDSGSGSDGSWSS